MDDQKTEGYEGRLKRLGLNLEPAGAGPDFAVWLSSRLETGRLKVAAAADKPPPAFYDPAQPSRCHP
ncbi:hypothetical protein BV898_09223 [Hypsibius exemplaris]|uniref:Uncharacterized protein n=1 Tax=Hypsibius exemplaris TaxID=2072580 RepID=A0A1W0WNE0_HYPEX|nr:hypothetical protein BV898_09223 [Hypsibius exemplaris]